MKQKILIITGTILILAACGVWIYLLVFGAPDEAGDFFANLGGNEVETREFVPDGTGAQETALAVGNRGLEQITTRPVAGFAFVTDDAATSTDRIIYAERGTGHVYLVDLVKETEERVHNTTFTAITGAVFAPDGSAVVLITTSGYDRAAYLEEIPALGGRERAHEFPADASDIMFVSNNEVRYARADNAGTSGFSYDLDEQVSRVRFTIPLSDTTVLWSADRTLVYPKPAPHLLGALYRIDGSVLTRMGDTGYGLSIDMHPTTNRHLITSVDTTTGTLYSSVREPDGALLTIPITALPEKCAFGSDETALWCAAPVEAVDRTFQADWYKGTVHPRDIIWRVDAVDRSATVLVDPFLEAGRAIDVLDMAVANDDSVLAFTNKIDDALWIYRLSTPTDIAERDEDVAATSSASQ